MTIDTIIGKEPPLRRRRAPGVRSAATEKTLLLLLARGHAIGATVDKLGLSYGFLRTWRRDDPAFDLACRAAIEAGRTAFRRHR